ncbi:uncharacterized protein SPPG_00198 [Spizellomyces punctatus DAOM BR117]|uniref:Uncharacterized protein n=1 Tax=Spizellomyces punctatus (strain DAOM BR117) TaxID=645134 RepID=A0A0L0HSY6_SPIPD|nr:uncharacterized protein SPPG_00198 [Spizellomyces punctatus DAOM BR117]KND04471.1 hypothetical protein SPPG_00198 [Spizellomyces punctatus DAOM BR117]|eukprot:XP_016612510.1 hypothetical protein SPPG_00198 [Spizellomyces punctatus DAOM BR117]
MTTELSTSRGTVDSREERLNPSVHPLSFTLNPGAVEFVPTQQQGPAEIPWWENAVEKLKKELAHGWEQEKQRLIESFKNENETRQQAWNREKEQLEKINADTVAMMKTEKEKSKLVWEELEKINNHTVATLKREKEQLELAWEEEKKKTRKSHLEELSKVKGKLAEVEQQYQQEVASKETLQQEMNALKQNLNNYRMNEENLKKMLEEQRSGLAAAKHDIEEIARTSERQVQEERERSLSQYGLLIERCLDMTFGCAALMKQRKALPDEVKSLMQGLVGETMSAAFRYKNTVASLKEGSVPVEGLCVW